MTDQAETIQMLERRFNWFPAKFSWQGRVYTVDAVNECKTVTDRWSEGGMHHFWVRSAGRRFHLCEVWPRSRWILVQD
jgi:hypothetical protein